MIEDKLEEYLADLDDIPLPMYETKAAKQDRTVAVREALKTIIEGCGVTCTGCPIRVICRTQFRTEPWTWGAHKAGKGATT